MKCYHHNDLDGRMAAAIVYKWNKEQSAGECPIEFIECDYKDEIDLTQIQPEEEIVIVDFSFKPEVMNSVLSVTENVVWIDHHKTAEPYEKEYRIKLQGLRDYTEPGLSGAELTWKHFFPNDPMPYAVQLTGSYDTWRHDLEDDFAFNEGMKLNAGKEVWLDMLSRDLDAAIIAASDVVGAGYTCIGYRDALCNNWRKGYGYEVKFEGLNCYALNVYGLGSKAFGDKVNEYDAVIAYIHDGNSFTVSMYTERDDVDVSAVCKKNGGGGHSKAAGFVCSELPFKRS